ncbi:MAG: multiheme c-type cytochrome [Kofleriaceae bacterium]|nr:multiheme c-type cytochrome [Kofleriaceae bacterium]
MKYRLFLLVLALAACGGDDEVLSPVALQDPNTCLTCHPRHYQEWSGSMHAYASEDPVFVAMNKRGQRETNGELGLFCVNCHAPMAVANGTITEANVGDFDFSTLTPSERGVTCYFCHNVDQVTQDHNNGLVLANDSTMRGGLVDPVKSPAHLSKYDPRMDGDLPDSDMCGSCHDIVNGHEVRIERTFAEWKETIFGNPEFAARNLSCSGCHMESDYGLVADAPGLGTTVRDEPVLHSHMFPGIDQALTPFPEMEAQAEAIKRILDGSLTIKGPVPRTGPTDAPGGICVDPPGTITVRVDNVGSGHSWPSGSAFERRAWLEVIAYRADNSIVFQSGVVPDGMDPEEINDPNLFAIWDRIYKADGSPAHFFWDITRNDPSWLLRGPVTTDQNDPNFDHSRTARFTNVPNVGEIARVTARVRIRALPYSLLRELVASGDLAAGIEAALQTLDVRGTIKEWDVATAGMGNAINTNCSPR